MATKLACAAKTDVGLKRTNNEDNLIMVPSHGLYVLADGMGGHASGQVASTMCVSHVAQFICEISHQPNFEFPYKADTSLSYEANLLVNAIKFANERVYIQSCKDRAMEGMGTTVTAILNAPHGLVLAHVGDSRIYRVRHGKIVQMSRDHSLLNHLLDTGELKPEDVPSFGSKNVILRAIGLKDYVDVDVKEVPREQGDVYMMCSDGLSDIVSDDQICQAITDAPNLTEACNTLIDLALKAGGKDNVTVVCVEVEKEDGIQSQPVPAISRTAPPGNPPAAKPVPAPNSAQVPSPPGIPKPAAAPMGGRPQQPVPLSRAPGVSIANSPVSVPSAAHIGMAPMPMGMPASFAGGNAPNVPPVPAKPLRMHSVREVVLDVVPPVQRAMPKPIAMGRSSSMSMPAVPVGKVVTPRIPSGDGIPAAKEEAVRPIARKDTVEEDIVSDETLDAAFASISKEKTSGTSAKFKAVPAEKPKPISQKPAAELEFKPQTPILAGIINAKPSQAAEKPGVTETLKMPGGSVPGIAKPIAAKELKQVGAVSDEVQKGLPETNLLFMTPPTSATEATDDLGVLEESDLEPEVREYRFENERTIVECPVVTDAMLKTKFQDEDEDEVDPDKTVSLEREGLGAFPQTSSAPSFVRQSLAGNEMRVSSMPAKQTLPPSKQALPPVRQALSSSSSRTNLPPAMPAGLSPASTKINSGFYGQGPVPGASESGAQIVSTDAINASASENAQSRAYVAPKGVVMPPANYNDDDDDIEIGGMPGSDDSIEIGYDSDDDEDDVTRRFIRPPHIKKW
ncbi:MAG: Stp1/IreP family PP2C-type Ser/Thr phosphatase [Proteobacteria bacterium]|nr:Stp1/IreP family PP2C-type Ser/Thr phosphatase [Pseudomonadota bacterium]